MGHHVSTATIELDCDTSKVEAKIAALKGQLEGVDIEAELTAAIVDCAERARNASGADGVESYARAALALAQARGAYLRF